MIKVTPVSTASDAQTFLQLPRLIYDNDTLWTPLPEALERQLFNLKTNPLLRHVKYKMFLAWDQEKPVGRIASFIEELLPDQTIGFFGCFEAVNDPAVSRALLNAAAEQLSQQGKKEMQGPVTMTSQTVGLLIDGFELPPQMMLPYNPPYYAPLLAQAGLVKQLDLYAYLWQLNPHQHNKQLQAVARRAARIPNLRLRRINLHHPRREGSRLAAVYNQSMTGQWGFVPMNDEEAAYLLTGISSYADPDLLTFCEVGGEPVGVSLIMPDPGPRLRAARQSRLSCKPFSWSKPPLRVALLGVIPAYHRRGVVGLLIDQARETAIRKGYRQAELSLVMASNRQMNRIITTAAAGKVHKVYRIYRQQLAP